MALPAHGFEAGTALGGSFPALGGAERRIFFRSPVEVSRPIAVGPAVGTGSPPTWWSADILDLSSGGFCLLLLAEAGFQPQDRLRLNLRSQPGFGVAEITTGLRWYVVNGAVVTLGVGFDEPLDPLPKLV